MRFITRVLAVIGTLSVLCLAGVLIPVDGQETFGTNRIIHVRDAATGNHLISIPSKSYIAQAALNEDGSKIIAAFEGGTIEIYDFNGETANRVLERTFPGEDNVWLWLHPTQAPHLWFVFGGSEFWLWDINTDEIRFSGEHGQRHQALLSSDMEHALISVEDGLNVYDVSSGEVLTALNTPRVWDAQWSPSGTSIAVAHNGGFTLFDSTTGEALLDIQDERFADVYSLVRWSPDGSTLLAVASPSLNYEDTVIIALNGETLEERFTIPFDSGVYDVNWSADSTRFVSASSEQGVHIYDGQTGEKLQTFDTGPGVYAYEADWNQDDTRIAATTIAYPAEEVYVWDVQSGEVLSQERYEDSSMDFFWNNDHSAFVVKIYPDNFIDIYNAMDAKIEPIRVGHRNYILGTGWSGDGQRIITWTGELRG